MSEVAENLFDASLPFEPGEGPYDWVHRVTADDVREEQIDAWSSRIEYWSLRALHEASHAGSLSGWATLRTDRNKRKALLIEDSTARLCSLRVLMIEDGPMEGVRVVTVTVVSKPLEW